MHQETNQYEKLANISYDKDSQIFSYDNLAYPRLRPAEKRRQHVLRQRQPQ